MHVVQYTKNLRRMKTLYAETPGTWVFNRVLANEYRFHVSIQEYSHSGAVTLLCILAQHFALRRIRFLDINATLPK